MSRRWRTRVKLDAQLGPYKRRKMTAPQIAMLEVQFLDRALLESAGLPRLSLLLYGVTKGRSPASKRVTTNIRYMLK